MAPSANPPPTTTPTSSTSSDTLPPPSITTTSLTYLFPNAQPGLSAITLTLPPRSRTLLLGPNGSGKTTLLRLLAGKRLSPPGSISLCGTDPFSHPPEGITYLGLEWVLNPVVRTDISVSELLKSVGGDYYPERRDELVKVLDVDVEWRMHAVSDGERRRVQLCMGLVRPWRVLLLDEVTVDLDLLARSEFLGWLKGETERRACTIVYATHILGDLGGWPTHLVHMAEGRVKEWGEVAGFVDAGRDEEEDDGSSKLGRLVLRWLREDLKLRGPRGKPRSDGMSYALGGVGGYGLESVRKEARGA